MKRHESREYSNRVRASNPATAESMARRKPVHGVGVNDADYNVYPTRINGKRPACCPAYQSWVSMLNRVASAKYHKRWPTYASVTVCNEWLRFSSFREWWMEHQVDGWELDKDLLTPGERTYSPGSCIYIPGWLNSFTLYRSGVGNTLPVGVSLHKLSGLYRAECCHPFGKREYLGYFSSPDEAYKTWLARKVEIAVEIKPKIDAVDPRLHAGVLAIINGHSHEIS